MLFSLMHLSGLNHKKKMILEIQKKLTPHSKEKKQLKRLYCRVGERPGLGVNISGQIIATSHALTPNGGLVGEIPLFQGNLGWLKKNWPDIYIYIYICPFSSIILKSRRNNNGIFVDKPGHVPPDNEIFFGPRK